MEQAGNGESDFTHFSGAGGGCPAYGAETAEPAGATVGVVGLGLIGGSLARAFARAGLRVAGCDRDENTVREALESGAVREAETSPAAALRCDYVFVALYPGAAIRFVRENRRNFRPGATVVDCCGVKARVCAALYPETEGAPFRFIGGHPMAGTEESGFSAARADLFDGASFLLTPRPGEDKAALEKLAALLKTAGFGRFVVTTPERHDRLIAFTSQLPHAIACSYVLSPSCRCRSGFSAGSYRDVSRVAHINAPLWAELFCENEDALCAEIDSLVAHLQRIRSLAARGDREALASLLAQARAAKEGSVF